MNQVNSLEAFAARLRARIASVPLQEPAYEGFASLALELFHLQLKHNQPYRRFCEMRGLGAKPVEHWTQIPAIPAGAFKELELSCLPVEQRIQVFFSSGTTGHQPSRHYHGQDSLGVYEDSLTRWFEQHFPTDQRQKGGRTALALTPNAASAPHSSLVHMFDALRRRVFDQLTFTGNKASDGSWSLDCGLTLQRLTEIVRFGEPVTLLGTAFSFVHLLDYLADWNLRLALPANSNILETGGYKGRSRSLPKVRLHSLMTEWLGVPRSQIVCEYGMSELSSQAYDGVAAACSGQTDQEHMASQLFHFPPWARCRIVSPETGQESAEGETGLIQVFDLANVYSVMAIQTEDLGARFGSGFQLIGRLTAAEPRGCSLLEASQLLPHSMSA